VRPNSLNVVDFGGFDEYLREVDRLREVGRSLREVGRMGGFWKIKR